MTQTATIPGYTYGTDQVARSPLSEEDLALLKRTLLWTDEDDRYLRMAGAVLADQVEDVLDLWYGFVASHPHLVQYFAGADGRPIEAYLSRVRLRFGQWIRDTCERPTDRRWLDYQMEIALRHHRTGKNRTDGVDAAPIVPLRYLLAFIVPITATVKDFLARKGHTAEDVERMHQAWFKSVVLQATLWSYPYVREGDF
ncbi:MAG TPA: protoglobin domain-containing protein [Roseiflexaceae bacterium]|nr:protoglobin domain-containing protein [Roseiflexaceae bacterium]